ncbi:MAG TPA: rhomboid family intramembrane serine protease [Anaerolineales bacterium]|nr:rhomboid family intramembrane serine protease [Anaerolineales bacterium]
MTTDAVQQPATSRPPQSLRHTIGRFPATYGLIGATLVVFLLQLASTQLLGVDLVLGLGAKINEAIAAGEIWRLLSPIFIHVGLIHFFVNMYSLYAIGPAVERFFEPQRMLVLYLLSGFGGVVMSMAFSANPSVGASGAIFGLLGALGMFLFRHRHTFGRAATFQFRQIVLVALLNLGLGLVPGIDNWGHVGGLIAGAGLTAVFGPNLEPVWGEESLPRLVDSRPWKTAWPKAVTALVILSALALAATMSPFVR